MSRSADVVVIGSGAAGLAAAYAARRRDASVILVERRRLGGDCTWAGCVPSKALIEQARKLKGARDLGLDGPVDFAAVMQRVADVVTTVSRDEDHETLAGRGITVLDGQATFEDPATLSIDGTRVTAGKAVVIATGSTALLPPIPGLAESRPLTNDTVFDLRRLPERLAVIGGGPIGVELGQAFARLGSSVSVLEGLPRLLPREEPESSQVIGEVLAAEGVELVLGSFLDSVVPVENGVALRTKDGFTVRADTVLCAVGRKAQTDGLEPERAGVELDDRGFVRVDEKLRTTAHDVFAIGDVTGGPQFTHSGYDQGSLAVANALGFIPMSYDPRVLPWATFTEPEVGRVGMTEAEAYAEHGDRAKVAFLPIAETDRAKVTGAVHGFVKLVAGPHQVVRGLAGGQILGATVVCPTGGDVVHELALAMRTRMLTGRLAQLTHAYPTWSLAVREAAAQFFLEHKGTARPARPGSVGPGEN